MARIFLSDSDYYFKFYGVGENEVYLPTGKITLEIEEGTRAKLFGTTGGKEIFIDASSSEVSIDNYYSYLVVKDNQGGEVFIPLSKVPVEVTFSDNTSYYAYLDSSGFNLIPESELDSSSLLKGIPEDVDALLSKYRWNKKIITYSFNEEIPNEYYDSNLTEGWAPFPPEARDAVREIFSQIESFTDLKFVEVSEDGDIRFNLLKTSDNEDGFAFYPVEGNPLGGDVFINNEHSASDFAKGKCAYSTLLHEIGHALGLKHPFDCCPVLSKEKDNSDYTVMTYTDIHYRTPHFYHSEGRVWVESQPEACRDTYGFYDVAALQLLYGANSNFNAEDTYYDVNNLYNEKKHLTIWDTEGIDTIDASRVEGSCFVDLRPGTLSSIDYHSPEMIAEEAISTGDLPAWAYDWAVDFLKKEKEFLYTGKNNLAISYNVLIENLLTGSGDDFVVDNQLDNSISTGDGNDTVFLIGNGHDVVDGGGGYDKVIIALSEEQVELEDLGNGEFVLSSLDGSFHSHLFNVEDVLFNENGFDFSV